MHLLHLITAGSAIYGIYSGVNRDVNKDANKKVGI